MNRGWHAELLTCDAKEAAKKVGGILQRSWDERREKNPALQPMSLQECVKLTGLDAYESATFLLGVVLVIMGVGASHYCYKD